jgi:hypothetical protein
VSLASRQSADHGHQFLSLEQSGSRSCHPFDQLGQRRTASEGWSAAICQEPCFFDNAVTDSQGKAQPIAAYGIRLVREGIRVRQIADAMWIRKVLFEYFRVGQRIL